MKLLKYIACGLIMAGTAVTMTSCDDKDHPEAPRLFSPVVSTSANANTLVCTWQGIKEAVSYELTLMRALPNPNEDGSVALAEVRKVTIDVDPTGQTNYSPYTFEDLEWDERYCVCIKALGDAKESRLYTTELTTITYPTKLRVVNNIIDTAAKIEWADGDDADIVYMNVFVRNADGTVTPYFNATEEDAEQSEYYYTLSEKDLNAGYAEIYGLEPETDFRVIAYSADGEYRGRRDFHTQASEVFDNPELVIDLRAEETDTLKASLFDELPDGAIMLLKGGTSYITTGTPKITKNFTLRTGMSLSGKATVMTGGFAIEGDVPNVRIENIKYTCLPTDDKTSNFGGRYFLNYDKGLYNIGNLIFEDVEIVSMRGVIRTRKDNQNIDNVVFNNCILDSIGGYKVIQLDNPNTTVGSVTITNSTLSNVQGVLRANGKDNTHFHKVVVDNCTFAYAGDGELFLLKKDGCNSGLNFSMTNCVIGANYPGKTAKGAAFNSDATTVFNNIFVTSDFVWATNDTGEIVNPLGDIKTMKESATDIWVNPAKGDFTFKSATLDCAEAGDPRWRVAK